MANKVLKITKSDKTVHTTPLHNKAFYQGYNNRLPADQRWKLEEIDESEAEKLPFIDNSYVTGSEAVVKNKELENQLSVKDAELEALKAQLAALQPPAEPAKTEPEPGAKAKGK